MIHHICSLILLLALGWPGASWAAVTETGTATLHSNLSGGTSFSQSKTVTGGANTCLTVQLTYYNGSGAVTPPTLSWNTSEAMTTVASAANAAGGNDRRVAVYYLATPTGGTFSVTGTFSNTAFWRAAIREWANCGGNHGGAGANGDSTTATVNVTSVVSGEVILDAVHNGANVTPTPGSGQSTTNLYAAQIVGSSYGGASTDTTSTGTVAMDWTVDSSWAIAAMALTESAGGGGGSTSSLLMMGVGK